MDIKGKRISIIGAVRSGLAAARLAKAFGAVPFVSDSASDIPDAIEELKKEGIDFEVGGNTELVFNSDFIVTSPGVPTSSEVLQGALLRGIDVYSELEFASWFTEGTIISITGTNGKTTTTSLLAHIMNHAGKKCYVAGNIGRALSDVVPVVKKGEFVALETSSFQLDYTRDFKPEYSVLLNITPDHLNRYDYKIENYIAAKLKVLKNQDQADCFIFNLDDKLTPDEFGNDRVLKYAFSLNYEPERGSFVDGDVLYFKDSYGEKEEICRIADLSLKGEHNLMNVLACIIVAKKVGVNTGKLREALSSFPGVEHRLEFVRTLDGVDYINDSKATNMDAVWYALRSFEKPLLLILGGLDKGNDYDYLRDTVLKHVRKIYAIGSSREKIYDYFSGIVETEIKEGLEDSLQSARAEAKAGEVLLLSPACASFDQFKSYEDRGEKFKEMVRNLK